MKLYDTKFNQLPLYFSILQMYEAGLINKWNKKYKPDMRQCLDKNKKKNVKSLGLDNLTGAFVVLGAGYFVSLIVFICEKIFLRIAITTNKKRLGQLY